MRRMRATHHGSKKSTYSTRVIAVGIVPWRLVSLAFGGEQWGDHARIALVVPAFFSRCVEVADDDDSQRETGGRPP